jgi:hypothetical protein
MEMEMGGGRRGWRGSRGWLCAFGDARWRGRCAPMARLWSPTARHGRIACVPRRQTSMQTASGAQSRACAGLGYVGLGDA